MEAGVKSGVVTVPPFLRLINLICFLLRDRAIELKELSGDCNGSLDKVCLKARLATQ
jgi:hypothetical protein